MAELLFIHVLDSSFIISVGCLAGWLLRLQVLGLLFSLSERLVCTEEPQASCISSVFVIKLGYRIFSQESDKTFTIVIVPWVL